MESICKVLLLLFERIKNLILINFDWLCWHHTNQLFASLTWSIVPQVEKKEKNLYDLKYWFQFNLKKYLITFWECLQAHTVSSTCYQSIHIHNYNASSQSCRPHRCRGDEKTQDRRKNETDQTKVKIETKASLITQYLVLKRPQFNKQILNKLLYFTAFKFTQTRPICHLFSKLSKLLFIQNMDLGHFLLTHVLKPKRIKKTKLK